jgi:exodeoxyribonuclease V alpha subunit
MSASRVVPVHPDTSADDTTRSDVMKMSTSSRLLALAPFARAESGLAGRLRGLADAGPRSRVLGHFRSVDWAVAVRWLRDRHHLTLAPAQEVAVQMVLTQPVSILTGGPGTGKTHTLRAVLTLARTKRLRCVLAAPTGRAAKRMQEATGWEASTLHRLLGLRPGGGATLGPDNPIDADLVVVDEVSMLDVLLANHLVKAIAPGTHLLLVGDPDQLPSVGAGNVLADLLASERFPVTRLTHIFRQGAGSGIALAAGRINAGEYPRFGGPSQDCFFLPAETPAEAADLVVDLVAERLPARYGFRPGDVQVLVPMHRGEAGVGTLNQRLQERLNPGRDGGPEARAGGRIYRVGDRVLQLRNDYELEVFNGDLGMIAALDPIEQEVTLRLDDGREVAYPYGSLYALTHAYAVSVHKAQGAEFPAVVIPLLTNHAPLLSRTLLYTAITRARQLVVLIGQRKALTLAVRDWRRTTRQTALSGLLTEELRFRWGQATSAEPAEPDEATADAAWDGLVA